LFSIPRSQFFVCGAKKAAYPPLGTGESDFPHILEN